MINKSDIERIREQIKANIGAQIQVTAKKGRKRVIVRNGSIHAVYPFTFNVILEGASVFSETQRNVSLTYADVLTGSISITLTETGENIQ